MMRIKYLMAIVAVAVMVGGCSSRDEVQSDERMLIRLAASVEEGSTPTATRTGTTDDDTQTTEFLAGQAVDAYIKVKGGDWLAQPLACTVTGTDGDLTYAGNCYYPMDATPVTIYAVHPSIASEAAFTVSYNQGDADNYAASDLCYSKTNDYNRTESKHELKFKHVLTKIVVNVDVGGLSGSHDVSDLRLWAKMQTSLTYPYPSDATNDYLLGATSNFGFIWMNRDGATGAAIIPPQKTTALGEMRISFDVSDVGPITYDLPAGITFAGNTQYNFNITVGDYGITVETSIQDWGTSVNDASIQFIPPVDIKRNPLWYVAEKNVDYTAANGTKTWDGGAGTFSFADDYNGGYYLTWKDVMEAFCYKPGKTYSNTVTSDGAQTTYEGTLGAQCKIAGYHLPVQDEWRSIVPGLDSNDIFGFSQNGDPGNAFGLSDAINCVWGYNATTRSGVDDKSYWHREDDGLVKIVYALRYLGTPYCSVWKYELRNAAPSNTWDNTDYGFLRITSRLIDDVNLNNSSNFSSEVSLTQTCSDYISDYSWESHFTDLTGLGEYSGNDEVHGAVRRTFYARGYTHSGTNGSTPDIYEGQVGYYPSATEWSAYPDDHVKGLWITSNVTYTFDHGGGKGYCWTVRLFRDRSDYPSSKAKTTIPLATTSNIAVGDIVCSDGSIYAAANAADVATEGKTPIGIIAYVNNEGDAGATTDIGNATTEKGKGRYDVKSLGRALVLCAMNIGGTANNATVGTLYQAGPRYGTLVQEGDNNLATSLYYWGFERTQGMNSATYPAAQAAYNFSTLTAPDCTTGWFLPSAGQWKKILNYVGGIGVADNKPLIHTWYSPLSDYASNINTKLDYLTAAGATIVNTIPLVDHHYWSSTNYSSTTNDNTYNGVVCNPSSGIAIGGYWGTESYYVRPVLAF